MLAPQWTSIITHPPSRSLTDTINWIAMLHNKVELQQAHTPFSGLQLFICLSRRTHGMNPSEKFWDRIAQNYGDQVSDDDLEAIKIIEHTKKYLHERDIVLDFACATGKFSFEIADLVQEVHGIDISSEMIAIAHKSAEERNVEQVHFSTGTIFEAPYEEEYFDAILAFNILHLLDDIPSVIQKIAHLLKPGGHLISATACLGEKKSFFGFAISLLSKFRFLPAVKFLKLSELQDAVTSGNFQIVETEKLSEKPPQYFIAAKKVSE